MITSESSCFANLFALFFFKKKRGEVMSVCRPEAGLMTAERSSGSQKPRTVALNFVIKVSTVSHDTWGSKGRLTEVTSLSTQLSSPFPTSLLSLKEEEKNVNLVDFYSRSFIINQCRKSQQQKKTITGLWQTLVTCWLLVLSHAYFFYKRLS